MQTNATQPAAKTASYLEIAPLMESLRTGSDKLPKSSTPAQSNGTVQGNTHLLPAVTLYNAHGILSKTNQNSLIGYA
jgi:hypothetical protein